MRAVQVTGSKAAPGLALTTSLATPVAHGSQVLIKVCAAGITGDEVTWPELYASADRVPGHDVSGVVERLGPDYAGPLAVGDSVFAMVAAAQAELVLAAADEVAPKPAALSHAQAAALPIPVLTAWEALFQHARLDRGSRVLVTGASGAVGAMLVQLASRLLGARVVGLAAERNHACVRHLGAGLVLDYASSDWDAAIQGVDAVFDTVGGPTLARAWNTVKPDGLVVTVADPPPPWAFGKQKPAELRTRPDLKCLYFIVTPCGSTLAKAAALFDDATLTPLPVRVFPADEALDAWAYARQRSRQAKAVIEFAAAE